MKNRLMQGMRLFNKRPEYERLVVTLIVMILVFFIWLFWCAKPLSYKIQADSEKIAQFTKNIAVLSSDYQHYQRIDQAPASKVQHQILLLQAQLTQLQHHPMLLKKIVKTPAELHELFRELSKTDTMLSFGSVQEIDVSTAATPQVDALFSRKVAIDVHGGYFEILAYLKYLESLPWYMSFDSLDYQVAEYPNAKVRVVLSVLSTQGGVGG